MEIKEQLNELSRKILSIKESVETEEATKNSMIMPFFSLLGYDVFNPTEFVPEYTADVGIKKNEKVDYAIIFDDIPLILIECKSCNTNLDKHASQLFRYYGTTEAKFGILTNGIIYKFYTDLDNINKMDSVPFLTIDMTNLNDRDITEINKFTKPSIDVDRIMQSAENLKYNRLIKEWLSDQMENPSGDFVRLILSNMYDGVKNQKVLDKFTPLVKRSLQQYLNDLMSDKIKAALSSNENDPEESLDDIPDDTDIPKKDKITTTIEELESYGIIKSILRKTVDSSRIYYRDTESYFGVLLDDNNRKWICRVHLTEKVKYIKIAKENKSSIRYDINALDEIYDHSAEITEACNLYL